MSNSLYKRSIKPNLGNCMVGLYKSQNKYIEPSIQEDIQEMKMIFSDNNDNDKNSILKEIRIIVKYDPENKVCDNKDLMIPFDISIIKKYFDFGDNNSNNRIKIKFGQTRPYDKDGYDKLYINNRCIGLYIYDSETYENLNKENKNIFCNIYQNLDFEFPDAFGNLIYSPHGNNGSYNEKYKYITLTKISIQEGIIFKNCTFKNANNNDSSIEVGIDHLKMVEILNIRRCNSYLYSIDAITNYLDLENDFKNNHKTLESLFNIIDNNNYIENPCNYKSSIRIVIGVSKMFYQFFLDGWSNKEIIDSKIIPDLYKHIFNKSFIKNNENENIFSHISYIVPKDQMHCTFSDMYRYYGYFGHINTHMEKEDPINKGKIRFSLHDIRSIR